MVAVIYRLDGPLMTNVNALVALTVLGVVALVAVLFPVLVAWWAAVRLWRNRQATQVRAARRLARGLAVALLLALALSVAMEAKGRVTTSVIYDLDYYCRTIFGWVDPTCYGL